MASLLGLLAAAPGAAQSARRSAPSARGAGAEQARRGRGPGCGSGRSIRTGTSTRSIRCPIRIEYPGPNAQARMRRRLCHRAPPERHRDRAAHALLVGAGLDPVVAIRTLCDSRIAAKPRSRSGVNSAGRTDVGNWRYACPSFSHCSAIGITAMIALPARPARDERTGASMQTELDRGQLGAAPPSALSGITAIGRTMATAAALLRAVWRLRL